MDNCHALGSCAAGGRHATIHGPQRRRDNDPRSATARHHMPRQAGGESRGGPISVNRIPRRAPRSASVYRQAVDSSQFSPESTTRRRPLGTWGLDNIDQQYRLPGGQRRSIEILFTRSCKGDFSVIDEAETVPVQIVVIRMKDFGTEEPAVPKPNTPAGPSIADKAGVSAASGKRAGESLLRNCVKNKKTPSPTAGPARRHEDGHHNPLLIFAKIVLRAKANPQVTRCYGTCFRMNRNFRWPHRVNTSCS